MLRQPDYEYRAEFVPGVGSMRPFVKPARPIPPPEIVYALQPGPIAETMGTSGGLIGFLLSSWCAASPVPHPPFLTPTPTPTARAPPAQVLLPRRHLHQRDGAVVDVRPADGWRLAERAGRE